MKHEAFAPLLEAVRRESLSLTQLGQLLDAVAVRVCGCTEPELQKARHLVSEAVEHFQAGTDLIDARAPYEPDPAESRRFVEEPV